MKYFAKNKIIGIFENLENCITNTIENIDFTDENIALLFSPGAASFNLFKNEFDRGEKFSNIINSIKK